MNETATATKVQYGLYSRGTKVEYGCPRRFYYRGPRGWVERRSSQHGNLPPGEWFNLTSHRGWSYGRLVTFDTVEEAEKFAFSLVLKHPEWMGHLEVRKV